MRLFADKHFNRNLLRLAMPIAIQSLMLAAVAAADAFMLGGVEQNAMSAVSLATQIQFVQNMILSSATARSTGDGRTRGRSTTFSASASACAG